MPTQITRLTREIALRETEKRAMVPMMSVTIIVTVRVMTRAVGIEPRRRAERRNMIARAEPIRVPVRCTMEAYWSKKM